LSYYQAGPSFRHIYNVPDRFIVFCFHFLEGLEKIRSLREVFYFQSLVSCYDFFVLTFDKRALSRRRRNLLARAAWNSTNFRANILFIF
jgi:uncharacterized protein involved in cysteine biosynthesis